MLDTVKEFFMSSSDYVIGLGFGGVISGLGLIYFKASPVIAAFKGTKDGLNGVEKSIISQKEDNEQILDILYLLTLDKVNSPVVTGDSNDRWLAMLDKLQKKEKVEKVETVTEVASDLGKTYLQRRG